MGRLSRVGVIRLALREQGRYTVQTTRRFPSCFVIIPQRRHFVNIQKCQFSSRIFVRNAPCRKTDTKPPAFLLKMPIFWKSAKIAKEKFKKHLTYPRGRDIIVGQMKQNFRSHPAAEGAQRLICSHLWGTWRAECLLRAIFYFAEELLGNWR